MGFGNNAIQAGSLDVGKSKVKMQKAGAEKEIGCCVKFCFIGSCIPSRSKVDTSISGTSANSGNFLSFFIRFSSLVPGNYFNLTLFLGKNKSFLSLPLVEIHPFFSPNFLKQYNFCELIKVILCLTCFNSWM